VPASCPALTPAQLAGITVNRSAAGALTLTGLPAGVVWTSRSVTFTLANTTVTGTVDAAGNITPTSALAAGTWTVTFTGQPALAPAVTNLTLASVVVPAVSAALIASARAMIVPQGVQKSIMSTQLAPSITLVTDAGFLQGVVNGDVLLIDVGIRMTNVPVLSERVRDLIYAVYRQNGNYYIKPLFKDDLTSATIDNSLVAALSGDTHDRYMGTANGLLIRGWNPSLNQNDCFLSVWQAVNMGFGSGFSNLCPIWI
jgi:hypothetical protein